MTTSLVFSAEFTNTFIVFIIITISLAEPLFLSYWRAGIVLLCTLSHSCDHNYSLLFSTLKMKLFMQIVTFEGASRSGRLWIAHNSTHVQTNPTHHILPSRYRMPKSGLAARLQGVPRLIGETESHKNRT